MVVVEQALADDAEGGKDLRAEGTFHFMVTACEIDPVINDKQRQSLRISVGVLDGTTKDENGKCIHAGKTANFDFWNPSLTQKNQGEFNRKRQTRLLIVLGIARPEDLGNDNFTWDTDHAIARQFIAKVVMEPWEHDGRKGENATIPFFDYWHVDDPSVADMPRDENLIKRLPAEMRWTADQKATVGKAAVLGTDQARSEPIKKADKPKPADFDSL